METSSITDREKQAYELGFRDGLETYRWMKDGTTWVGTCGTKLKDAVNRITKHWNYNNSLHILEEE